MLTRGDELEVDGDRWEVIAIGTTERGSTYVHLASLTRTTRQRNGARRIQSCGWYSPTTKQLTQDLGDDQ